MAGCSVQILSPRRRRWISMADRLRSWLAQAVVAALVYGGFGLVEPLGTWLVPPSLEERQARADSTLLHAQLVLARAERDTLAAWLESANAQLDEACRRLPLTLGADPTLCRDWLDTQRGKRGTR